MTIIDVDVLMVAHRRADYLAMSLPRLLNSLPEGGRAWVWQNESSPDCRAVIEQYSSHPRFHRFHHSPENLRLAAATNWLWAKSKGALVGKVDDDCLVTDGWIEAFVDAHETPSLGIIAAWHFLPEDLLATTVAGRTVPLANGRRVIRNCWVGGSGYLMKRACILDGGPLSDQRGFTTFCLELAMKGWQLGWHYPLILQDHMDDPRSENSGIRTDADLRERAPLSARRMPEPSVASWEAHLRASARKVQTASLRPVDHLGWKRRLRRHLPGARPKHER